jgi:hypothetical protein
MARDKLTEEGVKALAKRLVDAGKAWESGTGFSDNMTYAQAEELNFGRILWSTADRKRAVPKNLIDASDRFGGGAK